MSIGSGSSTGKYAKVIGKWFVIVLDFGSGWNSHTSQRPTTSFTGDEKLQVQ
jgi:hypothetical protein